MLLLMTLLPTTLLVLLLQFLLARPPLPLLLNPV
jgi:hypothetical protein